MAAGTFNLSNGSWAIDANLNAQTIAANTETDSAVVALGSKLGIEVSITLAYGTTITGGGVQIYILKDVDGTNYESRSTDSPYGFTLPVTASTTIRRGFFIPATFGANVKIAVYNPATNSTVTATVRTRDVTGATT